MKTFDFVNINPSVGYTKKDITIIRSKAATSESCSSNSRSRGRKRRHRQTSIQKNGLARDQAPAKGLVNLVGVQRSDNSNKPTHSRGNQRLTRTDSLGQDEQFDVNSSSEDDSSDGIVSLRHVECRKLGQHSHLATSPLTSLGATGIDPFWTAPIPYQSFIPLVWNHYITHLTPRVIDLDRDEENNLLKWFTVGFTEPASLYAHLAFGAAHLASTGSCNSLLRPENIFYLLSCAISLVNAALLDPTRSTSDEIISTVTILAGYEFAFGTNEGYDAHMEGCQRMIAMRGGIFTLDPFFQKLLMWIRYSDNCWKIFWPMQKVDIKASVGTATKEMAAKRKAKAFTRTTVWTEILEV